MIQNYLKTAFPIYDDIQKQNRYNECCQEDFYLYTDDQHIPSWQLMIGDDSCCYNGVTVQICDLDNNALAIIPPQVTSYHGDGYTWAVHDFRDVIDLPTHFPAIEYGVGYYLRITVDCGSLDPIYYSEVFKVCNCEVEGAGDGENLILNGWFCDWSGAADPNNVPDNWTVLNNDATNFVQDSNGECRMISDNTRAITIRQTPLTIGEWCVFRIIINTVILGGIQLYHNGAGIASWTTIGIKTLIFQATNTDIGIRRLGACDVYFTDFRIERLVNVSFCDWMTLSWWSDCDWDDIIYQHGFRNWLVMGLNKFVPTLQQSSEDIANNANGRLGEQFSSDIIIKKIYRFKIRVPEYLFNALLRLPAYGSEMPYFHAYLSLPDGSTAPMSEVNIIGEWDEGNCMNTLAIEFIDNDEYPVVATNCCDNEDISEV